ncbi:ribose-5-phosphate isomerase RpiA [Vulcanisaeta thermophila]|uniref:ribose-5-phosphate isomerase RpiA n=1 Tax=Vulcanisaeta thermophila TaxID=867917 RepID=UPI000A06732F|nr:ribose-5-phosphate isomerase RpiA [Vulcanisaeta thermophila]
MEDPAKIAAAREAVKYVMHNTIVGVGTGTTSLIFLRELARRLVSGELGSVKLVPTSTETEVEIVNLGLGDYLRYPWQVSHIDIAIDGADEVDGSKNLIKGGGGALTREKIIDYWAREFIVIVDETKLVSRVPSNHPIPIEVIPYAWSIVKARIEREFGGRASLRVSGGKRGPVITDNGNYILDFTPGAALNPREAEVAIKAIPGVVEVGLFSGERVSMVIVGKRDGSVSIIK